MYNMFVYVVQYKRIIVYNMCLSRKRFTNKRSPHGWRMDRKNDKFSGTFKTC